MTDSTPRNFLQQIIDADLQQGTHSGRVATRFPPEPNGYLHIGHSKSICLNFGLALEFGGECHLRFDDTNPEKEDTEYVESIKRDVRWLGFDWGEHLYFASDTFEQMYAVAVGLIKKGLAYVDDQTVEQIRKNRGSLTEAGTPSPNRDRSVEENLALFEAMRAGKFAEGEKVLRAKIDMAAKNMKLRDPLLYRIRHVHHHRQGDRWCIYPMYDFAHCLEDAFEHITHSICTLEFENNRDVYDWVIERGEVPSRPRQYEFARLYLGYTVMSKRKLRTLVEAGLVDGWDDPRMPTLAGYRRRGYTPRSIRNFCDLIGVAKANSLVDIGKLEYSIREDLNPLCPRVMAVADPLKITILNLPADQTEWLEAPYWPKGTDFGDDSTRKLPFTRTIYIDRSDFSLTPGKGFHRLAPGREVRLRHGYFLRCAAVIKDGDHIVELHAEYDPQTGGGSAPDGRKVKGTIHWVSASKGVPAKLKLYDRLFTVEEPDKDPRDFQELLNPDSLVVADGFVEPALADAERGARFQFERQGYFIVDEAGADGTLTFNRVVTLRDTWVKSAPKATETSAEAPAGPSTPKRVRPPKRSRAYERGKARAADPVLAERFERYQRQLSAEQADLLSGELALGAFFEAATGPTPSKATSKAIAKWMVNELLASLKGRSIDALPFSGEVFGELVAIVESKAISSTAGKEVLAELVRAGGDPKAIVKAKGLEQVDDRAALEGIVDAVLAANAPQVARYRDGNPQLLGLFIGKVMGASKGKANPKTTRELLLKKLG